MPTNPLRVAHRDALKLSNWIAWATGHYLGSVQHPRGQVLGIYRKARRDMSGVLKAKRRTMRAEAQEVLADARIKLDTVTTAMVRDAVTHGQQSAITQLTAYVDDGILYTPQMLPALVSDIQQAPMMTFDRQAMQVLGMIAGGGDVTTAIVGDAGRVGILSPAQFITTAADSTTRALGVSFSSTVGREPAQEFGWWKQAISAIDDRTTETCLNVAGQTQKVDDKFHLTGTPRFADDMDWVPFHWYCRTSVVLYLPQYDDGITEALRDDVKVEREKRAQELKEREAGLTAKEARKVVRAREVQPQPEPIQVVPISKVKDAPVFTKKVETENWATDNLISQDSRDSYAFGVEKGYKQKPVVSYRGMDIEMSNATNQRLYMLQQRGAPKLWSIRATNTKAAWQARIGSGNLEINTRFSKSRATYADFISISEAQYDKKANFMYNELVRSKEWMSPDDIRRLNVMEEHFKFSRWQVDYSYEGVLTHETGHSIDTQGGALTGWNRAEWGRKSTEAISTMLHDEYKYGLSEYPYSMSSLGFTRDEIFAECFSAYINGDTQAISPEMLTLLKKVFP